MGKKSSDYSYREQSIPLPGGRIARLFMSSYDGWKGRPGTTDRAVFNALIDRCKRDSLGTGKFRASVREISEISRKTVPAVRQALYRLQGLRETPAKHPALVKNAHGIPLVQIVGKDEWRANQYRFSEYVLQEGRRLVLDFQDMANAMPENGDTASGAPFAHLPTQRSDICSIFTLRNYVPTCDDNVKILQNTDLGDVYSGGIETRGYSVLPMGNRLLEESDRSGRGTCANQGR